MSRFYGKYRGKVENNIDPMQQGRVQVSVPAVLGDTTLAWAMPCAPFGGSGVGFFTVPPVGANVWVEFEGGDTDYPILAGCAFTVPPGKPQPCMKVQWLVPAARVMIGGQPAILQSSSGLCQSAEQIPQGPPTVIVTQVRASGT